MFGLLDHVALGYSTFFLGIGQSSFQPSFLWLYAANRTSRAVFYSGYAFYLVNQWLNRTNPFESKKQLIFSIGLLSLAAFGNLIDHTLKKMMDWSNHWYDWRYTISEAAHETGTWWTGFGNGEWFAFVGHNGRHSNKNIVPSIFMEDLHVVDQSNSEKMDRSRPDAFFEEEPDRNE